MNATLPKSERRYDVRHAVIRPVKVQCAWSGKYYAGRTRNLSGGGALLEFDGPARLTPGQPVRIGIAVKRDQALLLAPDLFDATVLRSLSFEGIHSVAISFRRQQALGLTA